MPNFKKCAFFISLLSFGVLLQLPVHAAEFRVPDDDRGNISVSETETIKNLYTAGAITSINGNITKSLYAAGGTVLVNGNVGQDIHAVGQTVIIKGPIGGTVHVAGSEVVIEGAIADDLFVAGGNVYIGPNAQIGGDLIVAAGNLVIEAPVAGKVLLSVGEVTINNEISGPVKGNAKNFILGPKAVLQQGLFYRAFEPANIAESAVINGMVVFDVISEQQVRNTPSTILPSLFGFLSLLVFLKILSIMIVGMILVYPFKKFTEPIAMQSVTQFWPALGIGFIGVAATPVVIILLAITLIGIIPAAVTGAMYIFISLLSSVIAAITLGAWITKTINKKRKKYLFRWQEVVVGTLAFAAINLVPVIGWITTFILFTATFGAMLLIIHKTYLSNKK